MSEEYKSLERSLEKEFIKMSNPTNNKDNSFSGISEGKSPKTNRNHGKGEKEQRAYEHICQPPSK